jgi:hypothetical protein
MRHVIRTEKTRLISENFQRGALLELSRTGSLAATDQSITRAFDALGLLAAGRVSRSGRRWLLGGAARSTRC